MTLPPAGSQKKGLFSREDYLAPPAIPTGQPPKDVLNTIWRKNEVFLDIGQYSIGSFVMILWPQLLIAIFLIINVRDYGELLWMFSILFSLVIGIPLLMLLYSLAKPVPLPTRFNRQRREVCVPQKDGSYWIVPWETVVAQAIAMDSVGRHGKTTQGMLVVGFKNPDPNAKEGERDCSMGFSCGGGTTAMRLWECMRSYMEIGPEAVPLENDLEGTRKLLGGRGAIWGSIWMFYAGIKKHLLAKEFGKALWLIFTIVAFGTPLAAMLQTWKLAPPPDLTDPAIVEWSKPLPPEQWAKRSPEWDEAIRRREAELAREAAT
ncbi:hypothetical protein AOX63_02735 [Pseudomonas sp. ADP]|uniref:hypothetical protein n=1 Tax=unclassified Pseudomonas TaxID=196821 RepID=UPI000730DB09|nr:hypothetical protein [Pseudomonas sp. ADPe]KSW22363.1 hypothetical protein AOX63_02735 [Pseudomonas sp. ADP]QOF85165.1 hypothetical protein IG194_00135 [Pseudomonas sp. ADPe]